MISIDMGRAALRIVGETFVSTLLHPDGGIQEMKRISVLTIGLAMIAAVPVEAQLENSLLVKLYAVVSNAFPDWLLYEALFRYPELIEDSMLSTYKEHVAIVEALKKGDADRAAQKSIEHVMESGKWLEEYLDIPSELLREKEEQVSPLLKKTKK